MTACKRSSYFLVGHHSTQRSPWRFSGRLTAPPWNRTFAELIEQIRVWRQRSFAGGNRRLGQDRDRTAASGRRELALPTLCGTTALAIGHRKGVGDHSDLTLRECPRQNASTGCRSNWPNRFAASRNCAIRRGSSGATFCDPGCLAIVVGPLDCANDGLELFAVHI